MRGLLRHADGVFHLSPRLTYVGREGCDIVIKSPFVDGQHALFEYSEDSGCFILQDLNSSQGTYVNDCRIQNAAVRLANRDVIRFGFNGPVYQLDLDETDAAGTTAAAAPAARPTRPPSARVDPYNPPVERGLPALSGFSSASPSIQPLWMQPPSSYGGSGAGSTAAPPPRLQQYSPPQAGGSTATASRPRPATAGSWRAVTFADAPASAWTASAQLQAGAWTETAGKVGHGSVGVHQPIVSGADDPSRSAAAAVAAPVPASRLPGFVNFEAEMEMKDQLVEQLTAELTRTRQRLQAALAAADSDEAAKRLTPSLEQELAAKSAEATAFKEQVQRLERELAKKAATAKDSETSKVQEICDLRNELERVKKDKNITSGLVTQMHRDMSGKQLVKALQVQSRDVTISRLTREVEALKKEVRDRDVQLATSGLRRSSKPASTLQDADDPSRDKSVAALNNQLKAAETKLQSQTEMCNGLRTELERNKQAASETQEACRKLRAELDSTRAELSDVHRTERTVRIDLEQALRKYERLHNRVVQVAYSMPGSERPSHEVKEDELMDALRRTIDERSNLLRQIADLKDKVKSMTDGDTRAELSQRRLKEHLAAAEDRLKTAGLLAACVRQEMTLLQTLSADGSDSVQAVKAHLLSFMALQLAWQQDIDAALDRASIPARLSRDPTKLHIDELAAKWRQAQADRDTADNRLKSLEAQHRSELESVRQNARQELAGRLADAVEKVRSEAEDKLRRELDELRLAEEERREQAVEAERRRAEELENSIAELRQSLVEQQESERDRLAAAAETVAQLEALTRSEEELRRRLEDAETLRQTEVKALADQLEEARHGSQNEASSLREQAQQHSDAVRAQEERLAKVTKKNKELIAEMAELKQTIKELKSKPETVVKESPPPPKPQVIVQKEIVPDPSSVTVINALKSECADLKRRLQEQQDAAAAARRDLAAAEKKLRESEASAEQSGELEKSRALVAQKERQATELRQQLAKLSHIAERQAAEIKQHEIEASKLKAELLRWRGEAEASANSARGLEQQLASNRRRGDDEATTEADASRVEAEMTALGAACRGERHAQVLERQREALAELRRRVKELEQLRPGGTAMSSSTSGGGGAGGSVLPQPQPADVALQQAALVKRELEELRTSHDLQERSRQEISSMAAVERAVSRARGITAATDAEAELERSAHRETSLALDESEKSYMDMVRAIAEALDAAPLADRVRSMAHSPKDERERVAADRERLRAALADKAKAMRERLSHKDQLLSDYERDLARLRRSEELVERKSQQVDALADEVQRRLDEVMYLRETLGRTKERLFQEKRLNSAIKQKKTFHLERDTPTPPPATDASPSAAGVTGGSSVSGVVSSGSRSSSLGVAPQHRCSADDPFFAKEAAKKKRQLEALKRKNYEIRTLREEVARQDLELYHVTTRLATVEQQPGRSGDFDGGRGGGRGGGGSRQDDSEIGGGSSKQAAKRNVFFA